jgi:hypothetical protein
MVISWQASNINEYRSYVTCRWHMLLDLSRIRMVASLMSSRVLRLLGQPLVTETFSQFPQMRDNIWGFCDETGKCVGLCCHWEEWDWEVEQLMQLPKVHSEVWCQELIRFKNSDLKSMSWSHTAMIQMLFSFLFLPTYLPLPLIHNQMDYCYLLPCSISVYLSLKAMLTFLLLSSTWPLRLSLCTIVTHS